MSNTLSFFQCALEAKDPHDTRRPQHCYPEVILFAMESNMDTFINLLAARLEPPTASSFPGAEQLQQNTDDVDFKTPLRPASASQQGAAESWEERTATTPNRARELERGEINEPRPKLLPLPSPSDTKSALRLRKRKPQFSIDHPKAGTITYGRVPVDPQVENLSERPFLESYRTALRLASATMEQLVDDDPQCLRVVEVLDAIHKGRNS
jgi:hypothetical protein